jgi:hypothetical protein
MPPSARRAGGRRSDASSLIQQIREGEANSDRATLQLRWTRGLHPASVAEFRARWSDWHSNRPPRRSCARAGWAAARDEGVRRRLGPIFRVPIPVPPRRGGRDRGPQPRVLREPRHRGILALLPRALALRVIAAAASQRLRDAPAGRRPGTPRRGEPAPFCSSSTPTRPARKTTRPRAAARLGLDAAAKEGRRAISGSCVYPPADAPTVRHRLRGLEERAVPRAK